MKEDSSRKLTHGGASISREAFSRAWSSGSLEEQGEMLFDLIGESLIERIIEVENVQNLYNKRIECLESESQNLVKHKEKMIHDIDARFNQVEKKWAYIAGSVAVLATLAGPVSAVIVLALG